MGFFTKVDAPFLPIRGSEAKQSGFFKHQNECWHDNCVCGVDIHTINPSQCARTLINTLGRTLTPLQIYRATPVFLLGCCSFMALGTCHEIRSDVEA